MRRPFQFEAPQQYVYAAPGLDRFQDAVNLKDYVRGESSIDGAFRRAIESCTNFGRRAIWVPGDVEGLLLDEVAISLPNLMVFTDGNAKITCTDAIKSGIQLRANGAGVSGLSFYGDYTRTNQVGTYEGAPLRERNAAVYVANADDTWVRDITVENMNVGVRLRGSTSDNTVKRFRNIVDGLKAKQVDFGVLGDQQGHLVIRRVHGRDTTFITTSPPHLIYISGDTNRLCDHVQVYDCHDVNQAHDASYKFKFTTNLICRNLNGATVAAGIELGDCDGMSIEGGVFSDVYYNGTAASGGILTYGCERGSIRNVTVAIRSGESIPNGIFTRVSNDRVGIGGNDMDVADCNVYYPRAAVSGGGFAYQTNCTLRTRFSRNRYYDPGTTNKAMHSLAGGSGHMVEHSFASGTDKIADIQSASQDNYVILDLGLCSIVTIRDLTSGTASTISETGKTVKANSIFTTAIETLYGADHASRLRATGHATANPKLYSYSATVTDVHFLYDTQGVGEHRFFVGGVEAFRIQYLAGTVNYGRVRGGSAGAPVRFSVEGSDSNIDLQLQPKGTGKVRLGTHSAIGAETVTGYITIADDAGNTRKIAVVS